MTSAVRYSFSGWSFAFCQRSKKSKVKTFFRLSNLTIISLVVCKINIVEQSFTLLFERSFVKLCNNQQKRMLIFSLLLVLYHLKIFLQHVAFYVSACSVGVSLGIQAVKLLLLDNLLSTGLLSNCLDSRGYIVMGFCFI